MDLPHRNPLRWSRRAALWMALASGLVTVADARAEVYKCQVANGRIQYSDRPCEVGRSTTYAPPPLTTIESDRLTGGHRKAVPEKGIGKWLPKPLDPIADCRARGGEIDKEFRACRLP